MAQQQHAAEVHPDELCPPNKRYDLMDANKKVDLEHVQCLPESKILTNIIKNHPLRFSIAASSSVPWIYMAQFWHTLKEDGSKRSTRLTPPAPVPTVDKADEMILQDTLQVSLAEHKSREEQEARENVELVNKHLASKEIEKMVEGSENVIDDSLPPRNDEPQIPGTRLEPRSDKESPEVESTNDEEVEITNVVIPVNVNEEEDEITDEVYELKRREKGKIVEESRSTPFPTPIRSPRTHTNLVSSDTEKLQELTIWQRKSFDTLADHLQEVMVESLPTMVDTHIKEKVKKQVPEQRGNIQAEISSQIQKAIDNHIPSQVDASVRSYMSGHILHVHPVQSQTLSIPEQQYQLYLSMKNDPQLQQQDIAIWLALQMKLRISFQVPQILIEAMRQKTYEYEAYVSENHRLDKSIKRNEMMMKYRRSKCHSYYGEFHDYLMKPKLTEKWLMRCRENLTKEILGRSTSRKTHSRSKLSRYPEAPTYLYKSRTFVSEERKFRAETIVLSITVSCTSSLMMMISKNELPDG
ncbi:hypothetical protein Tco_0476299 [Tanacetum coccineum]